MSEVAKLRAVTRQPQKPAPEAELDPSLDVLFKTQALVLEEVAFATNEMVDRAQKETHLFAEFMSKLGTCHSVRDWGAMYRECGLHQLEFIRRDCERIFRHSEGIIQKTSKLFNVAGTRR
ncbi:MAG: hypothetical protein FWD68_09795 [Alphaproteobacteria bacterium]|nr:hypothetical protein [Alphaproteobacteria bacterium]